MRRAFLPALLLSALIGPASVAATPATPIPADLRPLAEALAPVRATHGANADADAGPDLDPVKQALRLWVEQQLPPIPSADANGIIHSLDPADLRSLGARLGHRLVEAKLSCGGPASKSGCGVETAEDEDDRGYVGDVEIGSLDGDRYLFVTTGVGIHCGFDESFYLYDHGADRKWRLLLASEQDRYGKGDYSPENFLSFDAAPADPDPDKPQPPPLVFTLGFSPSCVSNWQGLSTRLWRASRTTTTPRPLIDRADQLFMGDDFVAAARLTPAEFLLEFRGGSIDGAKLVRTHIAHYLIHPGDRLERIAPVALDPDDFMEEWLTSKPAEAARWIDPGASRPALARIHAAYANRFLYGEFGDGPKQCRADPSLWQVSFAEQRENGNDGPPSFFQVRWMAPYRFTLVRAGSRRFPGCDREVVMPDNIGTLFPLQGERP